MITKAVRIYGENDLRLESFELPAIREDEILARVVSDSLCMSSYKAAIQGARHKRIPDDVSENPTMIGHEFCGVIVEAGKKWSSRFAAGDCFTLQPAHNKNGSLDAPGYSYPFCGGDATYIIIPPEIMEMNCLMKLSSGAFFYGSLAEPMSCIIRAFRAVYHTTPGTYEHSMGIKKGGRMAILAGAGPMGLGAVDYAIHNPEKRPGLLVVTDVSDERLARAALLLSPEDAQKNGVELVYLNTKSIDAVNILKGMTSGDGFDDILVFAPVKAVIEQGDAILAKDGCLNFFSGPSDPNLKAEVNFYNIHYSYTHMMGSVGGNNADMLESLALMEKGLINPAAMVTHIGGLDSVIDTTLNLPHIPGGKKLIYPGINLDLTAIDDFAEQGKTEPLFAMLGEIAKRHNGLWSEEAEKALLSWPLEKNG
ncbi:MAG: zinc-binding dehydrogenase [Oscillospiraceae bacterium]|nr:zinc-binding dehydrogenase [Oscillospiraceae bacterium]